MCGSIVHAVYDTKGDECMFECRDSVWEVLFYFLADLSLTAPGSKAGIIPGILTAPLGMYLPGEGLVSAAAALAPAGADEEASEDDS